MLKIVNCVFGEQIIVERRRAGEVTTIKISREDYPKHDGLRVRLSTEDQVDVVTALLWELPSEEKHKIIMSIISTLPDYTKRHYAPPDKPSRRW